MAKDRQSVAVAKKEIARLSVMHHAHGHGHGHGHGESLGDGHDRSHDFDHDAHAKGGDIRLH